MLAREVMTRDVVTVTLAASVTEVARLLVEHKVSGLPVVDEEHRVVGMITEGDLIYQDKKVHMPAFLEILGGVIYLENPQRIVNDLKKMTATKVAEVMTSKVYTVKEDASMEDIATIMVERQVNRLPVVDQAGKLVGIISRQDLVKAMI
ncbi:MAG: CBS domain-containing protein [Firmicutes bacterium]|jgi:CBS domain-containing protein|nr:CBS domain-containing protein [Bacillota bacterium]MCL5993026.1 CBS domain-containing protein [Bacillota bacterium]